MAFEDMFPEYRSQGREAGLGAVAEVLEVGVSAFGLGYVEQRYGEEKTTFWMSAQVDSAGNPIKDDKGNVKKQSGTGYPASAVVGVGLLAASVFLPKVPLKMRKHGINIATGFLAAWGYRKGIQKGQEALDSAQPPGTAKLAPPVPPYGQSAAALAEQANVQGELPSDLASLDQAAAQVIQNRQRRAA